MRISSNKEMFEKLAFGSESSSYIGIGCSAPKGVITWPSQGSTLEEANEQIRQLSGHGTNQVIVLNIKNFATPEDQDCREAIFGLVEAQIQIVADCKSRPILLCEEDWEDIKRLEHEADIGITTIQVHQIWLVRFYKTGGKDLETRL